MGSSGRQEAGRMGQKYGRTMGVVRRKDLKPKKQLSDEEFLARARATAAQAQRDLARQRRAEQVDTANRRSSP